MQSNQKYKDSLFSAYFGEKPERLIELYNALEGTNYPLDTPVQVNTLDNVLFKDRINDLSFQIGEHLVVLVEHQSTINNNMPLRMLIYLGRLYEKIIEQKAVYRSAVVPLPTPKFIVLYNGKSPLPEYSQQRLSDAFYLEEDMPKIELTVDVWNVNYGKEVGVIQRCKSLAEYALFVYCVREERKKGKELGEAITIAIRQCIQNDIMREFLIQKGSEVENMLYGEWNMDEALEIGKEEARKEGIKEGIIKTLCRLVASGLLSLTDAVVQSGISQTEFICQMKEWYPDYLPSQST